VTLCGCFLPETTVPRVLVTSFTAVLRHCHCPRTCCYIDVIPPRTNGLLSFMKHQYGKYFTPCNVRIRVLCTGICASTSREIVPGPVACEVAFHSYLRNSSAMLDGYICVRWRKSAVICYCNSWLMSLLQAC
jgi:hypothetical protein